MTTSDKQPPATLHIVCDNDKQGRQWAIDNGINPMWPVYATEAPDLDGARAVVVVANIKNATPSATDAVSGQSGWADAMATKLRKLHNQPAYLQWDKADGEKVVAWLAGRQKWQTYLPTWDKAAVTTWAQTTTNTLAVFIHQYEPMAPEAQEWRRRLLQLVRAVEHRVAAFWRGWYRDTIQQLDKARAVAEERAYFAAKTEARLRDKNKHQARDIGRLLGVLDNLHTTLVGSEPRVSQGQTIDDIVAAATAAVEDVAANHKLYTNAAEERTSRIRYQSLVYKVCSILDMATGGRISLGTAANPTTELEDTLRQLANKASGVAPSFADFVKQQWPKVAARRADSGLSWDELEARIAGFAYYGTKADDKPAPDPTADDVPDRLWIPGTDAADSVGGMWQDKLKKEPYPMDKLPLPVIHKDFRLTPAVYAPMCRCTVEQKWLDKAPTTRPAETEPTLPDFLKKGADDTNTQVRPGWSWMRATGAALLLLYVGAVVFLMVYVAAVSLRGIGGWS